jgi:hypothetical protein
MKIYEINFLVKLNLILGEISGSYGGKNEDNCLLGHSAKQ